MKKILLVILLVLLILLCAGCRQSQRAPFLPFPEPPPAPEMRWDVRADFSGLTPFVPLHSMHTRLHDGPLPELIPSDGYGMLLPYASSSVLDDGSLRAAKFGLVTIDGVIVTDLVYDRVDRAYCNSHYHTATPLPAYSLSINIPGTGTEWGFSESWIAVCALDGSWITPFDYIDVVFSEDVFLLVRCYETLDVDVYDYNGRILYNMLNLEWIGRISSDLWPGSLVRSASEGYGFIQMDDGTYSVFDVLTGGIQHKGYAGASNFSEGMAAVQLSPDNMLWGFIDKDFELVIPPRYVNAGWFTNGRTVVETPDGIWHLINKRGEALLSAPPDSYIDEWFGGTGYTVRPFYREGRQIEYTFDLVEIRPPEREESFGFDVFMRYVGGGWYTSEAIDGIILSNVDRDYYFQGIAHISFTDGEFVIYAEPSDEGNNWSWGVMTVGGEVLSPPDPDASIAPVTEDGMAKAFVVNSGGMGFFIRSHYTPSTYKLIGTDGGIIASGPGTLTHDEAVGLYSVLGVDHFSWLDMDGNVIISIPLMSFTLD